MINFMLGLIVGANCGLLLAGLFDSSKKGEDNND